MLQSLVLHLTVCTATFNYIIWKYVNRYMYISWISDISNALKVIFVISLCKLILHTFTCQPVDLITHASVVHIIVDDNHQRYGWQSREAADKVQNIAPEIRWNFERTCILDPGYVDWVCWWRGREIAVQYLKNQLPVGFPLRFLFLLNVRQVTKKQSSNPKCSYIPGSLLFADHILNMCASIIIC